MGNFEPKISNPLCFKFSCLGSKIYGNDKGVPDYPLKPGAIIGGEHFGFTLITDTNIKQFETTYPTQCRIVAAEIRKGVLTIYEENKYVPWRINRQGKVMQPAQFLQTWRPDVQFLLDHGIEDIAEVNKAAYQKKK